LRSNIQVQDIPPTTSLVYPGTNSRLVCVADSQGNKIPDFSNAGYKGGGEIMKYDDPGSTEQVGIENLRGISEYDPSIRWYL